MANARFQLFLLRNAKRNWPITSKEIVNPFDLHPKLFVTIIKLIFSRSHPCEAPQHLHNNHLHSAAGFGCVYSYHHLLLALPPAQDVLLQWGKFGLSFLYNCDRQSCVYTALICAIRIDDRDLKDKCKYFYGVADSTHKSSLCPFISVTFSECRSRWLVRCVSSGAQ